MMFAPERYQEIRQTARVRERSLLPLARTPNELELQARWFAGDFGNHFVTTAGQKLEIIQFGVWNREAGPDFAEAAVRLDDQPLMRGSIEFDLIDRNWELHGHGENPAFDDTVLHVFVNVGRREFFTRTRSHRSVAQVRVDPSMLSDAFTANLPLARRGRCHAPLKDLPEERVHSILEAAAQFRLQRKAARLHSVSEAHGRSAALLQEMAAALGYKQNKLPFTLLAQRLPLKLLREQNGEALLFGAAGFLDAPDLKIYRSETRDYVRKLWDAWWPLRDPMERLILPRAVWRLSGTRPLNHPQRRLAALAVLARQWPAFLKSLGKSDGAALREFLLALQHPYWNWHYTLSSRASAKPMALIGSARIADILANVFFPWQLGQDRNVWSHYAGLRAPLSNRRVETAATRLFGDDPRRSSLLKTVAHQQGLLQIYEDFCLQDNSDCAQCPFPEQLQKWK